MSFEDRVGHAGFTPGKAYKLVNFGLHSHWANSGFKEGETYVANARGELVANPDSEAMPRSWMNMDFQEV